MGIWEWCNAGGASACTMRASYTAFRTPTERSASHDAAAAFVANDEEDEEDEKDEEDEEDEEDEKDEPIAGAQKMNSWRICKIYR